MVVVKNIKDAVIPNMTKIKQKIDKVIEKSNNIVITSHKNPDDDAISSLLSLYNYIINSFPTKKVSMVINGTNTNRHDYFNNYSQINFVAEICDHIKEVDLLIFADGCQYSRFTNNPELIAAHPAKKICIDHHPNPPDIFDITLIDINSTSTVEIIHKLLFENQKISKLLADIILLGIIGDTGTFNYVKPSQTDIFLLAKKLIDINQTDIQTFKSNYSKISQESYQAISELIKNTTFHTSSNNPSFQVSFLSKTFVDKHKISQENLSEASHVYMSSFLRVIEGYTWGLVVTPSNENDSNISLRSLPNSVNVRSFMQKMAIGGGHDRAAGGEIKNSTPQKTIKTLISWIEANTLDLS